jgi:hypothetical protein
MDARLLLEFKEPRTPPGGLVVGSAPEPKALASSEAILEKLALVLDPGRVKGEGKGIEGEVVVCWCFRGEGGKTFGDDKLRGMRAMGAEEPGGARLGCCCCCGCDGGGD